MEYNGPAIAEKPRSSQSKGSTRSFAQKSKDDFRQVREIPHSWLKHTSTMHGRAPRAITIDEAGA